MKGFPGVSVTNCTYKPRDGRYSKRVYVYYKARLWKNGRVINLGTYRTKEAAAAAYRRALFESHNRGG